MIKNIRDAHGNLVHRIVLPDQPPGPPMVKRVGLVHGALVANSVAIGGKLYSFNCGGEVKPGEVPIGAVPTDYTEFKQALVDFINRQPLLTVAERCWRKWNRSPKPSARLKHALFHIQNPGAR